MVAMEPGNGMFRRAPTMHAIVYESPTCGETRTAGHGPLLAPQLVLAAVSGYSVE
jgi:hypothetical protein